MKWFTFFTRVGTYTGGGTLKCEMCALAHRGGGGVLGAGTPQKMESYELILCKKRGVIWGAYLLAIFTLLVNIINRWGVLWQTKEELGVS